MKSHELLRDVFNRAGIKQVADRMGLSSSLVYKWTETPGEGGSGSSNPLDRIESLIRSTEDSRIVEWICQEAGGFYVLNSKAAQLKSEELIPATNRLVQEFADMLSDIANAATDHTISAKEAEKIRDHWQRLKSAGEQFVLCCEKGTFSGKNS
jgi:hypothetical protein